MVLWPLALGVNLALGSHLAPDVRNPQNQREMLADSWVFHSRWRWRSKGSGRAMGRLLRLRANANWTEVGLLIDSTCKN